jgi:acyl dehydratase
MALLVDKLGSRSAEHVSTVDAGAVRAYAAATNDDSSAYRSGEAVPPVFGVVPTWRCFMDVASEVVPPELFPMVVHWEHDMHFHQPLRPGLMLVTQAEAYNVRAGLPGARFTARIESRDADGAPVLEQYSTLLIRGSSGGESTGPDKPPHQFPRSARGAAVGELTVHVDDDQTYRYRDASGDEMPIHVDEAFARRVGLPGVIVHGLCTMAMCSQAVVRTVAGGDPTRVRRLAVRFARPVFPGSDVTTSLYSAGRRDRVSAYPFEAASSGTVVIKDGLAEVED